MILSRRTTSLQYKLMSDSVKNLKEAWLTKR